MQLLQCVLKPMRCAAAVASMQLCSAWPQVMGKAKVLVKVHPEGKYVVDLDKSIDVGKLTPGGWRFE